MPGNAYVSDVRLNGVPVTTGILDFPPNNGGAELVTTVTPGGGEVQGTVVDTKSQPVPRASGLLLPNPLPQTIGNYYPVFVDDAGRFTKRGIAPGNYRLYTFDGLGELEMYDPDLLARSTALAVPIRTEPGSRVLETVRVITP